MLHWQLGRQRQKVTRLPGPLHQLARNLILHRQMLVQLCRQRQLLHKRILDLLRQTLVKLFPALVGCLRL